MFLGGDLGSQEGQSERAVEERKKLPKGEDLQHGGGVRCGDHLPPHKYIYMWNNSYRTPTECWQKTSEFPKGKKLPTDLGKGKRKKKKQRQKNRDGTCPSGRSCEGGKVSTH